MKRTVLAAFAGAIALAAASDAWAFCTYNKTNAPIEARQVTGGLNPTEAASRGFRVTIAPGGNSCCNWSDGSCNSGRKPTSPVGFVANIKARVSRDHPPFDYALCAAQIPADGWVEVRGRLPNGGNHPFNPPLNYGDGVECKGYTGRATIVGAGSRRCLDVLGWQDRDGAKVNVWDCHGGMNQRWKLTQSGEIRGWGDRCLDVLGGRNVNGAQVVLWQCHGGANQKWKVEGTRIVGLGGRCLDVAGGATGNGSGITLYDCHGGANQQWRLVGE